MVFTKLQRFPSGFTSRTMLLIQEKIILVYDTLNARIGASGYWESPEKSLRTLEKAAVFHRKGISIANELIDKQEESCGIMRALDGTVPAWNENYNPKTDRYEVGFFFDSMPRWRKDMISSKLAEFGEKTCIDFVNLEDEKTRPEFENRLKIVNGGGCWSYVGRHHKVQVEI